MIKIEGMNMNRDVSDYFLSDEHKENRMSDVFSLTPIFTSVQQDLERGIHHLAHLTLRPPQEEKKPTEEEEEEEEGRMRGLSEAMEEQEEKEGVEDLIVGLQEVIETSIASVQPRPTAPAGQQVRGELGHLVIAD